MRLCELSRVLRVAFFLLLRLLFRTEVLQGLLPFRSSLSVFPFGPWLGSGRWGVLFAWPSRETARSHSQGCFFFESNAPTSQLCRSIRRQEPARAGQGRPLGLLAIDQSALGFRVLLFTCTCSVPFCGRLRGFTVQIPSGGGMWVRGRARARQSSDRGGWKRGRENGREEPDRAQTEPDSTP